MNQQGQSLNNQTYTINAKGIPNSERKAEDGIAIFGIKNIEENFTPDIILNIPKEMTLNNPEAFLIYYRRDMQKYYLESISENKEHFFIFVLLSSPHILTTETVIVSVLNYNFKIKTSQDKKEVIIEYGQSENLTKSTFNNQEKKKFYIGRKADADIVITEGQVSREQTMIYFENDNWYIKDGGERPSGSGTWLFINKKYQIQDSFIFKIGPSKMKIDVNNNNNNINNENKEN